MGLANTLIEASTIGYKGVIAALTALSTMHGTAILARQSFPVHSQIGQLININNNLYAPLSRII